MPTGSTQPYNGASITFTTSNLTYISNGGGGTYRTGSGLNPNTVQWVKPNLGTSGTTSTMTVTAKVPFYARGSITTNTYIGSGSGGPAYGPSDIPSNNASTVITVNEESSIAQSQNSPQNTTDPKIKLITVTCDQQTCGTNTDWKKATISNNKTFRDYICSLHGSFAGICVILLAPMYFLGILLSNVWSTLPANPNRFNNANLVTKKSIPELDWLIPNFHTITGLLVIASVAKQSSHIVANECMGGQREQMLAKQSLLNSIFSFTRFCHKITSFHS